MVGLPAVGGREGHSTMIDKPIEFLELKKVHCLPGVVNVPTL
jgi:hypothetical protein